MQNAGALLRVATWNVNSLKVRLPQVLDWLKQQQPHILAVQDTKLADAHFPVLEIESAGYTSCYAGQKTYNGVALLSRIAATQVISDMPMLDDAQRRVLGATFGKVRVLNLYIPNGQALDSEKYAYKLAWLEHLIAWVADEYHAHQHLIVLGDFNIAPEDRDVYDAEALSGQVLCSDLERAAFQRLQQIGLQDAFRLFPQTERSFTHWDYRAAALRRNLGLRIDHILVSPALAAACSRCWIDLAPRHWPRPSDHTPVIADFAVCC